MMKSNRTHLIVISAAVSTASALFTFAPRVDGAPPARAATPSRTPPAEVNIQNLGDDRVMGELASRGLETLLNRMFDAKQIPDEQRKGVRTLRALKELQDPTLKLSNADRQKRARLAADGINAALPGIKDPGELMKDANLLIEFGIQQDANLLEYWGDSPIIQSRLKPVARTVVALLQKASKESADQSNVLSGKLTGANDPRGAEAQRLDELSRTAAYQGNMVAYYLALATDGTSDSGKAEREKIADDAITQLAEYDNNDSGVQPVIRNMISKLELVKGDFKNAQGVFDSVITGTKSPLPLPNGAAPAEGGDEKKILPAPTVEQQYDARYFTIVADLMGKDTTAAQKALDELVTWQQQNLPKETQSGVSAATDMMRYRILNLQASMASGADKAKADDAATAVLTKLREDHKEFASIIDEQLIARVPANKPVASLDPLVMRGLMNRGITEGRKPTTDKIDTKVVLRAIDVAKEVIGRKDRKGIDAKLTEDAKIVVPTLLERVAATPDAKPADRTRDLVEAGNAYLDYAKETATSNVDRAKEAIDAAGGLTFDLMKKDGEAAGVADLYDRFLNAAISPPFNHKELAYMLAKRLRSSDHPKEAVAYFEQVPKTDANYFNAQYFLLLSLQDALDKKLPPAERVKYITEVGQVGENVKQLGSASKEPRDRFKAAHATLIAAQVAIGEPTAKDPKRALSMLSDFEAQVKGLPGEKELLASALFVRVNSYMSLGQFSQATGALVKLLESSKPEESIGLVRQLLEQLDNEYNKADLLNDAKRMRDIANNEAQLTGFLSEWARTNKDPKIQKFTYQYRVYDAKTQRIAGTLAEDPTVRRKALEKALAIYTDLKSPANKALYKATLDPKKVADGTIDPNEPDINVEVGLAFVQFELGDYDSAQAILGDLIGNRKLGNPTTVVTEAGEDKVKSNDLYWEGNYKLYKSNIEIGKKKKDQTILTNMGKGLKQILIRGGIPERWQDEFEGMRQELIPDFHPTTQPTTLPVATR